MARALLSVAPSDRYRCLPAYTVRAAKTDIRLPTALLDSMIQVEGCFQVASLGGSKRSYSCLTTA